MTTKLTFIDWLSPATHYDFNRSWFKAINMPEAIVHVFDEKHKDISTRVIVHSKKKSRLNQTISVLRLCIANRKSCIFLMTYDSLFLPLILLFCDNVCVYEHNTVPENQLKHYVWQRLLYHRVTRLTQSPSQQSILSSMGQKAFYVGSPLETYSNKSSSLVDRKNIFVPSARLSEIELRIAYICSHI